MSIFPYSVSKKIKNLVLLSMHNPYERTGNIEKDKYYFVVDAVSIIDKILKVKDIVGGEGEIVYSGSLLMLNDGKYKPNCDMFFSNDQIKEEVPEGLYVKILEIFLQQKVDNDEEFSLSELHM